MVPVAVGAPRGDVEAEHHAALVVLGDVAVRHPHAGVGDVEQDVDDLAGPHEHGVLPHQVGLELAVAGEDQEAPGAVDVEGVVHRVVGVHLVDQPDLHPVADRELPVDRGFSAPVERSTSFQRVFAGVVILLTSTMSSSHSIPPAAA